MVPGSVNVAVFSHTWVARVPGMTAKFIAIVCSLIFNSCIGCCHSASQRLPRYLCSYNHSKNSYAGNQTDNQPKAVVNTAQLTKTACPCKSLFLRPFLVRNYMGSGCRVRIAIVHRPEDPVRVGICSLTLHLPPPLPPHIILLVYLKKRRIPHLHSL
jgi:hypothetical protein